MNNMLEINTSLRILKPVEEVFEAIVDPAKMSQCFISKSSGRLEEEGKVLLWKFPEFEPEFPVRTGRIEKNRYISFYWSNDNIELQVEMSLSPGKENSTIIVVTEKGRENNEAGITWLKGNTQGWANFLACLKAYLEYGINLRKGAFDYLSEKQ